MANPIPLRKIFPLAEKVSRKAPIFYSPEEAFLMGELEDGTMDRRKEKEKGNPLQKTRGLPFVNRKRELPKGFPKPRRVPGIADF